MTRFWWFSCGKSSADGKQAIVSENWIPEETLRPTFRRLESIGRRIHFRLLDAVSAASGQPLVPEVDCHDVDPRIRGSQALDDSVAGSKEKRKKGARMMRWGTEWPYKFSHSQSAITCRQECQALPHQWNAKSDSTAAASTWGRSSPGS